MLETLSLNWNDFEGSVQAVAALQSRVTHIITRNPRDFSTLVIPVLTAEEFLRSEAIEG